MFIKDKFVSKRLEEIVRLDANLPADIFHKRFSKYFFFDNDICTSDHLINATRAIVNELIGRDVIADVFSSTDFQYLGYISMSDSWIKKILSMSMSMNHCGDFGGLTILDREKRWVLFQKTPVDEGILGVDSSKTLDIISEFVYENFIDCEDIKRWLEKKTREDESIVQSMGENYLIHMLTNYC